MGRYRLLPGRPDSHVVSLGLQIIMFRWFIVIFLALMLINGLTPWLHKLGFGKLPGDLRFRLMGRDLNIPLASTVVLSLIASGVSKLI